MSTPKTPPCAHERVATSEFLPFRHCVGADHLPPGADRCQPRSHGNLRFVERCIDCGKIRHTNINGTFSETGGWHPPEDWE